MRISNLQQLSLAALSFASLATALPVEPVAENGLVARDAAAEKPLLRIVALGASITAGLTSNPEDGYRKHLRGLLRDAGYLVNFVGSQTNPTGSTHNGEHEGYPGRRILEVRAEFIQNGYLNHKPNIVLMHMGTNNCEQDKDVDSGANDIGDFADFLMEQIPGTTIVMSTLGPLGKQSANELCQNTLNPAIRNKVNEMQAAKKNVHIADFAANPNYTIADIGPDGTHPKEEGFLKLSQMWFDKIQDIENYNLISQPIKTQFSDAAQDDANAQTP